MIGIIVAMDKELKPLIDGGDYRKKEIGGKEFYLITIGKEECVIVKSGIGKVNAAYSATLLTREFQVTEIISTGISGGLGRRELLELVVSTACVQYDVDTSPLGDPLGLVSTINKIYFDADKDLVEKICQKSGAKKTVLACGDRFVADEKTKRFIIDTFDGGACDMESGAIAQIAYLAKKPYVAIRCISDGAGEGAEIDYEQMTDKASKILADAVKNLLS